MLADLDAIYRIFRTEVQPARAAYEEERVKRKKPPHAQAVQPIAARASQAC
jgi:hypothetical protein